MKKSTLCLFLILLLGTLLRFYRITTNPPHLYWDEASIAYNAYSINQTGRDEWGVNSPVLFKSFGEYKLPAYIYLTAFSQKIFGLTDFAVRFPSALAGVLAVLAIYFLAREFFKSAALMTAFLLAISPWHLQFSRAGFEANLALLFVVLAILFFILGVKKNPHWYFAAAVFFALPFYTYHSGAVTAPLILAVLVLIYRRELVKKWKQTVISLLLLILLILPFFPSYVTSARGRVSLTGESFLNMPGSPVTNFVNNYVANFSLDYLFFHGDQDGRHSVKKLGELYFWQFPTVLAGVYFLLKWRSQVAGVVFSVLLIGALPPALTVVSPHALRGLMAVWSWQILSAVGIVFIFGKLKPFFRLLIIPVVVYALLVYLHVYYVHYPKAYAADWQDGERQAVAYVKGIEKDYDNIFVYKNFDAIYLMLYWPIEPKLLQQSRHDITRFGKIQYFDYTNLPTQNKFSGRNLLLVPEWFKYDDSKILRQFNMAGGQIAYKLYEL